MEHIVHRKVVNVGYCEAHDCYSEHIESYLVCSCGFNKPFGGDSKDFKIEALSHIVAHGVKGQVAGTVYERKG